MKTTKSEHQLLKQSSHEPPMLEQESAGPMMQPPDYGIDFADSHKNRVGKRARRSTLSAMHTMPEGVQAHMEGVFGMDFSSVKIHKNSQQASTLGAWAYTQGNNIHFAPGKFQPHTGHGRELLGHELAHVMQQRSAKIKPTTYFKGLPVNEDSALEKEADFAGARSRFSLRTTMNTGSEKSTSPLAANTLQLKLPRIDTKTELEIKAQKSADGSLFKAYERAVLAELAINEKNSDYDIIRHTWEKAYLSAKARGNVDEMLAHLHAMVEVINMLNPDVKFEPVKPSGWSKKIPYEFFGENPEWEVIRKSIDEAIKIIDEILKDDDSISRMFPDQEEYAVDIFKLIKKTLNTMYSNSRFRSEESNELSEAGQEALSGSYPGDPDTKLIKVSQKFLKGDDLVENAIILIHEGSHSIPNINIQDLVYMHSFAHGQLPGLAALGTAASYEGLAREKRPEHLKSDTPHLKSIEALKAHPGILKKLGYTDMLTIRVWVLSFRNKGNLEKTVNAPEAYKKLSSEKQADLASYSKANMLPVADRLATSKIWEPLGIDQYLARENYAILNKISEAMGKTTVEVDIGNSVAINKGIEVTNDPEWHMKINKNAENLSTDEFAEAVVKGIAVNLPGILNPDELWAFFQQMAKLDDKKMSQFLDLMK